MKVSEANRLLQKVHQTLQLPGNSPTITKKNAFQWFETAQQAFETLKDVLTSPPVLTLPNFTIPFVIECDASATIIGAVLMQYNHPIACISQEPKNPEKITSAYEREILGILFTTKKWRQYLLGRVSRPSSKNIRK